MKRMILALALVLSVTSMADFKILKTSAEFKQLVAEAQVPVIVQFSAYWCGPCQDLKATFTEVASDYSDSQVLIAYVDAYVNSDLKSYLQGGYPTTRTFLKGQLASKKFVGSEDSGFVTNFINSVIASPARTAANFCAVQ